MAGYTHEYSNFPESVTTLKPHFKDVDANVGRIVTELQTAKSENDFMEVARILEANPSLVDYIIDATIINTLIEENRNAQIYAMANQQNIYIGDKPEVVQYGDIRIGQPTNV